MPRLLRVVLLLLAMAVPRAGARADAVAVDVPCEKYRLANGLEAMPELFKEVRRMRDEPVTARLGLGAVELHDTHGDLR